MSKPKDSSAPAQTSVSHSRTARWQPSARDLSSPTYDGSGGYRSLGGRRSGLRARFSLGWVMMALVAGLGAFALLQVFSVATDRSVTGSLEAVAVLELVQGAVGLLTASEGAAETLGSDPVAFAALGAGTPIQVGAVLDSSYRSDLPGRAALRLASGPAVRLDHGSRLQMASATTMVLDRGAVYVDAAAGSGVEIRTVLGVVRDIGTQFEVRLLEEDSGDGPALRVRVREGEIELEPEHGVKQAGTVGEEVILHGDGRVERREVAIHGSEWDWALDLAPSVELEGWSLHRFVTWLGREGGWKVRYAAPEVEQQAREIILHGDSRGLGPLDTAQMVFEGTALGFRIEEADLWVELAEASP